jgi:hypothetical protein
MAASPIDRKILDKYRPPQLAASFLAEIKLKLLAEYSLNVAFVFSLIARHLSYAEQLSKMLAQRFPD